MKKFLSSTGGKVCVICVAVVLLLAIAGGGYYAYWLYQQPKFHDVTIELGESLPEITEFMTQYAKVEKSTRVTSEREIDLTGVGDQSITFTHGTKEETVTLTIVDTTAPTATFQDVTVTIDTVLTVEDFVTEASDLSEITVEFASELTTPDSYGDVMVEILVTDASGNVTTGQCRVYYVWMNTTHVMELGETLSKADLLLDPEKDDALIDQAVIDEINASPAGSYTITSTDGDMHCECTVTVQDTTAPTLELKDVTVYVGEAVALEDFLVSAGDISGDVTTTLLTELDTAEAGTKTVTVEAVDVNGNKTTLDATLEVIKDTTAPTISGIGEMTVSKNSSPNYTNGVSAADDRDGAVKVTYDASGVDLTKAGTYYVTYTAKDSSGNVKTVKRKVTVKQDQSDTDALVAKIAASLPDDPEAIRDYVRNEITYNHNWGGDDPIWYGFTKGKGNCYVHALCLQALLTEKGYTTQLIWVEGSKVGQEIAANGWPAHYWLIINLDGTWWHIDGTPGNTHTRYSLMNDEMRYELLYSNSYKCQRDWDRTKWPACDGERRE